MKTLLSTLTFCVALSLPLSLRAEEYVVYKIALKLPIVHITNVGGVDKVETLTLTGDDFVNIALGRQLGTPISKTKEILAIAGSTESNIGMVGPKSHVIIYDLEMHQPATPHLGDLTTLSFQTAFRFVAGDTGFGAGKGDVHAHTAADPAKGTIFATTMTGAAAAGGKGINPSGDFNVNLKGAVTSGASRLHLKFTDKKGNPVEVNGIVFSGTATVSGFHLDKFTE